MSRRRERRSTIGPNKRPMTTIGRKFAIRSAATHSPELVASYTSTVSAMAARYVPKLDPAVARKRYPNAGDRRRRPRRLELSTTAGDASTWSRFRLRPSPAVSRMVMCRRFGARSARPASSLGLVGEVLAKPALGFRDRHPLPSGVVRDLVLADSADREVARLGVAEVEAAHARPRRRRARFRETDAGLGRVEQAEQRALLGVVRARRVAERRPDAAEALPDQLIPGQRLARRVPLVP